jgi:hypothetical protein
MSATASARAGRKVLARQSAVVATAVEPLVVRRGDLGRRVEAGHPGEDHLRVRGMAPEHAPLRLAQALRLVEDQVRDPELAEVVEQRGPSKLAQLARRQSEPAPDADRHLGHAYGVAVGPGRLRVNDSREGLARSVEGVLFRLDRPVGGLHRGHARPQLPALARERPPEGLVAPRHREGVDELGIEPRAAAPPGHLVGGRATLVGEDLDGLRQSEDGGRQRYLLSRETGRITQPVPVLVEPADRLDARGGEPERGDYLGAAIAAQLGELAGGLRAAERDPDRLAKTSRQRSAGARGAQDVSEGMAGGGPRDRLAVALDRAIVGGVERADPGRAARAPGVLEQQGVEEGGDARRGPTAAPRRSASRSGMGARRSRSADLRGGRARRTWRIGPGRA